MQSFTPKGPTEQYNLGFNLAPAILAHVPEGEALLPGSVSVTVTPTDMTAYNVDIAPNSNTTVTWTVAGGSTGTSSSQSYVFTISGVGATTGNIYSRQAKLAVKLGGNS